MLFRSIWREIESDGAGIVNTDTLEGTEKTLRQWLAMTANGRHKISQQAKLTFEQRFTVDAMAQSLIATVEKYSKGNV